MTNLEIALKIAEKINNHTQAEIDAMMNIISEVHNIEPAKLLAMVSNCYARLNPSAVKSDLKVGA